MHWPNEGWSHRPFFLIDILLTLGIEGDVLCAGHFKPELNSAGRLGQHQEMRHATARALGSVTSVVRTYRPQLP